MTDETKRDDSGLGELIRWPRTEAEVTVDGMLRIIGADTQRLWLEKMAAMTDKDGLRGPLYAARTHAIISAVGLMQAIRALAATDADAAMRFVRDYWTLCDAGDSFGECLWEWTEEAGLDPSLIVLQSQ